MIRLRQIKKSFQDKSGNNDVLRGIDLEVREREFVSVMGPSGAGKSLLLQKLNREGTTIIQVTHSEFNAGFGNRVLHIFDGQIGEPGKTARATTTETQDAE